MELYELTISQAHKGLINREFSCLDLTKAYLERIEREDKRISAYITITEDLAVSQAKKADELISSGREVDVLTGIPLAVKDNILVSGVKNTCASKILENYLAPYDAAVIKKLKNKGAVILGKTNMDEFAMGASCENSAFFPTKNPHNIDYVPGGSSGGSAASVAANLSCYALGSDTGGSIRQPASFCGIVGLKPTYGAVSRYGLVAFASSLDQIGPLTKTAEDAKIVFKAIKGKDEMDSTSLDCSDDYRFNVLDFKIGIPKEYFIKGIEPDVEKIVKDAIGRFESLGFKIEEVSLPHTKYVIPTYYLINTSEASANLARYDGIKYGLSRNDRDDLIDVYLRTRGEGFGREVKRRIMLGTFALSSGYYDAYYLKAQKVRTLIKQDFERAFEKVDFILSPTSPTPAFKIKEKVTDPLSMYLCDVFTAPVNLAGLPSISIPIGFSNELPVGLQLTAKPFKEDIILEAAQFYQKNE
ncbi:MAG: Asp-tRNA(Asn)/Glu-tRNA(Gln) amidotransferase subunit GatA [Candidatus Pacebacteria bacterium]|nr:Asp-tRNA(Asn)/Glu-tRNA(Gln) amidotransferase subunit GatA [Candidatus Paceibacterota bacterium]